MTEPIERNVAVGYVHGNTVHGWWHDSLMTLCLTRGIGARVSVESGTRIASSRNAVVKTFLDNTDCEWLWMVDTDMTFEPDIIERMVSVATKYDFPIVGGLCFGQSKTGEAFPVAFRLTDDDKLFRISKYPRGDLIEVAATGAACILIHRDVLSKMLIDCEGPHHWFEETTRDGKEIGEDVAFCLKARELGFRICIDTSIPVGHLKMAPVNEQVYLAQMVEAKRQRRKQRRK